MTKILRLLFQQQLDPIAFTEEAKLEGTKFWFKAWLIRLCLAVMVLLILGVIAYLNEESWQKPFRYALITYFMVYMYGTIPGMITFNYRFWFLYAFSPFTTLIVFLAGLNIAQPLTVLLFFGMGGFFVGASVTDIFTMWMYRKSQDAHSEYVRLRSGSVLFQLPTLIWLNRAGLIRFAIALLGCVVVIFYPITKYAILDFVTVFGFLVGCLHFDAIILSWIKKIPLVIYNTKLKQWRPTYVSRVTLFISHKRLYQLFTANYPPNVIALMILILFKETSLASFIRKAWAKLPPLQTHQLMLFFSVQEGGGTVLRYLQSDSLAPIADMASVYATLAIETNQPIVLQRWLAILTNLPNLAVPPIADLEVSIPETLDYVKQGLLSHQYTPVLDKAINNLQLIIAYLNDELFSSESVKQVSGWPVILLEQIKNHKKHLISNIEMNTVS